MKRIIRVFPKRTNFTPEDAMVYIGGPDMLIPEHDEVHISCTFTWDRKKCEELQFQWQGFTDKPVLLGGGGIRISCGRFYPRNVCQKQCDIHIERM